MSNQLDNFEKAIQESLNSHEVPYNAQHWNDMNSRLDALPKGGGGSSLTPWLVAASVGAAIITTGVILFNTVWNSDSVEQSMIVPDANPVQITEQIQDPNNADQEVSNTSDVQETQGEQPNDTETNIENTTDGTTDLIDNHGSSNDGAITVNNSTVDELPNPTDSENINSTPAPTSDFVVSNNVLCEGGTVSFMANTPINDRTAFEWNFGDGTKSNGINPSHTYNNAGNYVAKLKVTDVPSGKTATTEYPIVINEAPKLDFRWTISEENTTPVFAFENLSNTNEVTWNFGDGTVSQDASPDHTFSRKGLFDVTLNSANKSGCSSSVTREVPVDRLFNLFVEEGFSPNGDGVNETFMPKGLEILDVTFTLTIYDAMGSLIFETDNYNNPWDGQMKDGSIAQDTYVWIVVMKTRNGDEDIHKGTITLVL